MLAFSAAIHVDPEILIVDEVLAVGDAIFVNRCVQKLRSCAGGASASCWSPTMWRSKKPLCDRAVLLYHGRILADGDPNDVVNRYNGLVLDRQRAFDGGLPPPPDPQGETVENLQNTFRHGDGQVVIAKVELFNEDARPATVFRSGHMRAPAGCSRIFAILMRGPWWES